MAKKLRVGIIGAGRWSKRAHIPGWVRSDLCELVVINYLPDNPDKISWVLIDKEE